MKTFQTISDQPVQFQYDDPTRETLIVRLAEGRSKYADLSPWTFPNLRAAMDRYCSDFGYDEEKGRYLNAEDFIRSVELHEQGHGQRLDDGSPASSFNIPHDDARVIAADLLSITDDSDDSERSDDDLLYRGGVFL